MTLPVPQACTLITDDGVPIDVAHLPGQEDLAIIVAHGFTLSWQRPSVWRVVSRMHRFGVWYDFSQRTLRSAFECSLIRDSYRDSNQRGRPH